MSLQEIRLLGEYRTRVVADLVTGKLDVRTAAALLPEEPTSAVESELDMGAADEEFAEDELAEADV